MKLSYQHTVWACNFGFISQAVVNNLAPLLFVVFKEQFGLTDEQLGRLILMNFGTQIVADILATRYVDRIGQRICAVAAHLFCAGGLILMGVLPFALPNPYLGLCVAAVLYAMGGGIIEVMVSPIVEALPGEHKEKAMSMAHSFYCWGQAAVVLISTLLLWRFSQGMWRLLPIGWALIPLANSVAFARVPLMPATPESERTKIGTLLKSKAFFIAILMMVASGSAELSMSQWSSLFAEQALGVNKVLGDLLGPCAFALCMAFTRMMYGLHGEKVAVDRALVLSAALCIVCYLTAVLSTIPFLALIGCALCGVSVGLMWPGTVSATARRFPLGGTAMFGLLAISGDIGCSVGPWLTGVVSDAMQSSAWGASLMAQLSLSAEQLGLKAGLLVAAVFPVLLLVCALIRARQNRV